MTHSKLLLSAILIINAARAEFIVTTTHEEIAERGRVLQYVIQADGERYQVMPPVNWSVEVVASENKLLFRNEREGSALGLTFSSERGARNARELGEFVAKRFANARVVEHFACVARDAEGVGVSTEFTLTGAATVAARIAVLNYSGKSVEVMLSGSAEAVGHAHTAWTMVLNSLCRLDKPKDVALLGGR